MGENRSSVPLPVIITKVGRAADELKGSFCCQRDLNKLEERAHGTSWVTTDKCKVLLVGLTPCISAGEGHSG